MRSKMNTITIPGTMYARITDGRIEGFCFQPAAADAGYFGEAFHPFNWDGECEITEDEFSDMVADKLMLPTDRHSSSFVCEWQS